VNEQTNAANIYILPPHIIGTLLFNKIGSPEEWKNKILPPHIIGTLLFNSTDF
jgi:hypothetical protein